MSFTAERFEAPSGFLSLRAVFTAAAPLLLVISLMAFNSDLFFGEREARPGPIYYTPVAVVFVGTTSEDREVSFDATVEAERRVALRAESVSQILRTQVRPGDRVAAGQPVCRIKALQGGDALDLFSPIAGEVSSVNGGRGTVLAAGQPCVTITDTSSMIAMSQLTPRQAEIIGAGDITGVTVGDAESESEVRVVYSGIGLRPDAPRDFEVTIPETLRTRPGQRASLTVETRQVMPTLVPFRALILDQNLGLAVRIVTGSGPTGHLKTLPVTLVATSRGGFYVEGLPIEARLVVKDSEFTAPEDGEVVRIGRVG